MTRPAKIHEFLSSAKVPSLGSLGEAIFDYFASQKYKNIESSHVELCDFIIDNQKIDVKTSAKYLTSNLPVDTTWKGNRVVDVQYATVSFYNNGAEISIESDVIGLATWSELEEIYSYWSNGKYKKRASSSRLKHSKRLSADLKDNIINIFRRANLPDPYILYRTVMFPGESPHNLLPSQRREKDQKGWTVFLVFSSAPPLIDNLDDIIAFPDSDDSLLPRLKNLRTSRHIEGLEKADLDQLPSKYKFADLDSLDSHLKGVT